MAANKWTKINGYDNLLCLNVHNVRNKIYFTPGELTPTIIDLNEILHPKLHYKSFELHSLDPHTPLHIIYNNIDEANEDSLFEQIVIRITHDRAGEWTVNCRDDYKNMTIVKVPQRTIRRYHHLKVTTVLFTEYNTIQLRFNNRKVLDMSYEVANPNLPLYQSIDTKSFGSYIVM